jgi:hypothetical protein
LSPLVFSAVFNAFLDDIAGKFVFRIHKELRDYDRDNLWPVLLVSMYDYMLSNIVAILISNEMLRAGVELDQDWPSGGLLAML